jgi:apolipoprotein N-acyltransferase
VSRGPRLTGAARAAERRRENLDIVLGILGFFTAVMFVATAVAEVRGEPALGRALLLAVMVALVLVAVRARRSLARPGVPTGPASPPADGSGDSGTPTRG